MNLLLTAVFLLIPSDLAISERIMIAIKVNIAFHLAYQLISHFFIWVFELVSKDNPNNLKFAFKFFIGFTFFIMILPSFPEALISKFVIFEQAYEHLFNLIFLSGVVLGRYAMKSKFKIKETL